MKYRKYIVGLLEANLEVTKDFLRRGGYSSNNGKPDRDNLYRKIFDRENSDARKYRIYLPFESDKQISGDFNVKLYEVQNDKIYDSEVFRKIAKFIIDNDLGDKVESINYKDGMVNLSTNRSANSAGVGKNCTSFLMFLGLSGLLP